MANSNETIPIVMTSAGLQPANPTTVQQTLIANVASTNPGYTVLPAGLIEDVSSTDVGAIVLVDAALVELVNSISPATANPYIAGLLGQQAGILPGVGYNTNVDVVFTGPPGLVIAEGFVVSDGANQYATQDSAIIGSSGSSPSVYCLAQLAGSFAVPANTVTQLITGFPSAYSVTVTNPNAGIPGVGVETAPAYQARVVQAGLAVSQGMTTTLRTALQQVSGVSARLVSVRQQTNQWEIIVGGGDPYQVANAIFLGLFDISTLVGSTLAVTGITQANPGVVTTDLNHGYTTGKVIEIEGIVGMTELNNVSLTATVITPTTFSIGVNTTGYTAYVSGGMVTPNLRNEVVNINDYPDTYAVPFVIPPQQIVGIIVTWNTFANNFISPAAISQAAQPAIVSYINNLVVGQPLNLLEIQQTFQDAIASILPSQQLVSLTFSVTVNGIATSPEAGTSIIPGDPESYFFATAANIVIVQA